MEKELIKNENKEVLTIDSREVAKMVGKKHNNLLRDVDGYVKVLNDNSILSSGLTVRVTDYFIKSNYQLEDSGRKYPYYLVTKKGCEMIANKLTGKKGVLFTAEYIERFHFMEEQLVIKSYKLPQTFSEALRMLADKVDENGKLQEENKIMKPKSEFYDRVTKSETTFKMNDVAKILNYKDMGRNKMFAYLRNKGILMVDNRPYQRFVDSGYFKEIESEFVQNGEIVVNHTTCVYQKGIDYIRKLLDKDGYEINKRGIKEKKENVIQLENINN